VAFSTGTDTDQSTARNTTQTDRTGGPS